jgi:hypothetical protein
MSQSGMNALQRKFLREGRISPRAMRKRAAQKRELKGFGKGELDGVADNGRVSGAVGVDHINRNGRQWPAASTVKASNNTQPKRQGPIRPSGPMYGGPNGRP